MGISKNAEFHADFESVEKSFEKVHNKKVISKNVAEKSLFYFLPMFFKLFLLITFFVCIFYNFFQRVRNQREILRFFGIFSDL
jgi:hypothetical protein